MDAVLDATTVVRLTTVPIGIIQLGAIQPHERPARILPAQTNPQATQLVTVMAEVGIDPFLVGLALDDGERPAEILRLGFSRRPTAGREQIIIVSVGGIGDGTGNDFSASPQGHDGEETNRNKDNKGSFHNHQTGTETKCSSKKLLARAFRGTLKV